MNDQLENQTNFNVVKTSDWFLKKFPSWILCGTILVFVGLRNLPLYSFSVSVPD